MGFRKNAPGRPCCETPGCTFDRNDLPVSLTIDGRTIPRAYWLDSDIVVGGAQYGCCWGSEIGIPDTITDWEFYCSTETSYVFYGDTYGTKLVAYRQLNFIDVNLSYTTMACDGGPSVLQYWVTISKHYRGAYGNQYYYPPAPSCQSLVYSMAFSILSPFRYHYQVVRSKSFTSFGTGTYTMVDGDVAVCTPAPQCRNFGGGDPTSVTIENTSTGQSIVFDDTEDWDFDIVY